MKTLLKKIFLDKFETDKLIEGAWAHEYSDITQDQIRKDYLKKWSLTPKEITPETHPWLFDPCEPPEGWSYDPFYEIWIKII